jgi:LPS-assembly protein
MRGLALAMLLVLGALASQADAQSPPDAQRKGSLFAPPPREGVPQPLYLQADNLFQEGGKNRVILRGSVELYFNNYILVADEVIYEQREGKLIATGNARLKDPNGSITRADRLELGREFVDAFEASLKVTEPEARFNISPPR